MQTINALIDRLEEDSYPPNDNGVALRELDFTELRRSVNDAYALIQATHGKAYAEGYEDCREEYEGDTYV